MKNRLFPILFFFVAVCFDCGECSLAVAGHRLSTADNEPLAASSVVSQIFARPMPADYRVLQAGGLTKQEGSGEFLVLTSVSSNTKVVIVEVNKLSWLKTKEIESANSAQVGKQLVSRFFPHVGPVSIVEDKQENNPSQYASHLRLTRATRLIEPAIALRLLYPKNKAYILFLWEQGSIQNFPQVYLQLENQAKTIISELRVPEAKDPKISERYILWRLRHIFKKGAFTHLVEPNTNQ